MTRISLERIASIESRRHELAQAMARADVTPDEFVKLSKDYAAIEPVADAAREVRRLRAELEVLDGMGAVAALRRAGIVAELIASGSPRKRFDKAVKSSTRTILALSWSDEGTTTRLRNVDGDAAAIESALAGFAWSKGAA